jgi:Uma2 family endonuclease
MALTDPTTRFTTDVQTPRSKWDGARMTLDEFLALPEDSETALEYDDGVVTQKVAPQYDHARLQSGIAQSINGAAEPRRQGLAVSELRFVVPGWAPVPDVSYIRKERIKPESRRRFGKIEIPPDIAIEIVSPEQRVGDLLKKCLRYADVGIPLSLLVDPDDETIYAIRPGQPLRVLQGDDRIDLDDVLPGFDLTVRALFDSIVPDWLVSDAPPDADETHGAS